MDERLAPAEMAMLDEWIRGIERGDMPADVVRRMLMVADLAREKEIRDATATLAYRAWKCGMGRGQEKDNRRERLTEARRDLLAIFGIEDQP